MRPEKKAIVKEIRGTLEKSEFAILADCRGLNSERLKDLRVQLHGAKAGLTVVPNALFGVAAKEVGWEGLAGYLSGPTAIIHGAGDITQVAKVLKVYTKATNVKLPVIKGGYLTGQVLLPSQVATLADIPSREILLGQVVGTIAAPLSRLVGVMQQKVASLLYVLKAVADKKAAGN
jgi:large subunit ribosomal protein L10